MNESILKEFTKEILPLYDTTGREAQLPQKLQPAEAVLPESEELEKWRNTHGK